METLEHGKHAGGGAPRVLGPLLFRLLCADDLSEPPGRYSLSGVREVQLGRAPAAGAHRSGDLLRLGVRDAFASSRHARITREDGAFRLSDDGSRNGTLINGSVLREPVALREGDLIEIGHTFFLFRASAHGISSGTLEPISADPPTLRPEWELVLARAARLACTAHGVLIEGESGAGKELLARLLHQRSGRRGALISVNCAAVPENLFEDELFGHVRGAFSGAQGEREGLIRAADKGTLFLDEVGDLPLPLQAKLLRVLEDHRVRPLGAEREVPVDVRVIAATHRSLDDLVSNGSFRQDLFARLGLLALKVPAVRERREDLGLLIRAVLRETGREVRFELEALRLVLLYPWPLNVRELRQALLAAVDLAGADGSGPVTIAPHHLPEAVSTPRKPAAPIRLDAADRERRDGLIEQLRREHGNLAAVARQLNKGRTQIQRWIARYRIDVEAIRRSHD